MPKIQNDLSANGFHMIGVNGGDNIYTAVMNLIEQSVTDISINKAFVALPANLPNTTDTISDISIAYFNMHQYTKSTNYNSLQQPITDITGNLTEKFTRSDWGRIGVSNPSDLLQDGISFEQASGAWVHLSNGGNWPVEEEPGGFQVVSGFLESDRPTSMSNTITFPTGYSGTISTANKILNGSSTHKIILDSVSHASTLMASGTYSNNISVTTSNSSSNTDSNIIIYLEPFSPASDTTYTYTINERTMTFYSIMVKSNNYSTTPNHPLQDTFINTLLLYFTNDDNRVEITTNSFNSLTSNDINKVGLYNNLQSGYTNNSIIGTDNFYFFYDITSSTVNNKLLADELTTLNSEGLNTVGTETPGLFGGDPTYSSDYFVRTSEPIRLTSIFYVES
jgi:hypothetical protein